MITQAQTMAKDIDISTVGPWIEDTLTMINEIDSVLKDKSASQPKVAVAKILISHGAGW